MGLNPTLVNIKLELIAFPASYFAHLAILASELLQKMACHFVSLLCSRNLTSVNHDSSAVHLSVRNLIESIIHAEGCWGYGCWIYVYRYTCRDMDEGGFYVSGQLYTAEHGLLLY